MSRCEIPADYAIFIAEDVEYKYATETAHVALKGINNCFQIDCNYMEPADPGWREVPFKIVGALYINPSKMTEVDVPFKFEVKGVRLRGKKSFFVHTGNIGKYQVKNKEVRIDATQGDNALFFVKVWLPSQALLANKSTK